MHGAYHAAWCWEEHFIPFFYAHGYNVYAMSFRNHGNSERIENVDTDSSQGYGRRSNKDYRYN